jgi:HEAT repeat protein
VGPVEALLNSLEKGDYEIRNGVFEKLRDFHNNDVISLLVRMLDRYDAHASSALKAIAGSADPATFSFLVDSLIGALGLQKPGEETRKILEVLGSRVVDKLTATLTATDPLVRARASATLGDVLKYGKLSEEQKNGTLSRLYHLIQNEDSGIRRSALATLSTIGDPRSLAYVLEWLEDEDIARARHALREIKNFDDVRVIAGLVKFFERVRNGVRNRIVTDRDFEKLQGDVGQTFSSLRVLRGVSDFAAVEPLVDELLDEAASLRGSELGTVARLLVEIGHQKAVPALKKLVDRGALSDYARQTATEFVSEHRDKWEPTEIMRCALCNIERPVTETRPYHDGTKVKYFCRDTCWENRGRVLAAGIGKDCPYYAEGMCRVGDVSALCSLQVGHYKTDCHVYKMYPIR